MGAGVVVSALISPYNYVYDLAMLAAAARLLCKTVLRHARKLEQYILATIILLVGAYGAVLSAVVPKTIGDDMTRPVSILGPVLFAGGIVVFRVLWRSSQAVEDSSLVKTVKSAK
ncbi:hypothetical protein HTT03_09545 [Sulfitobacter sp. S0837]|nr:hypothetical protein [Sulfitobacter maritimus]